MTVQEIIEELFLKYPNSYTNTQVVNRMDRIQKRIFRNLNTLNYSTSTTTSGTNTISTTLKSSQIRKLTIDGVDYGYWTPEEDKPARYWYWMDGNIVVFPTPTTTGLYVEIWSYKVPTTLSASSLSATPDLDSDYHMMLVYGIAKEIAEDLRDGSMATAFVVAYNDLENEMMQSYENSEPYVVKEIAWG
ncbi:hypothetical protein UFOVP103_7 [uncultured Caudovirales phage]|uniref:Uncharacterized protein n=1 Tax=uncultured Caudovirales phage TaxID=2100421 RepID=A0A6J7WKV3_9CAUD|nr:hypothetical protein UFOVP103_7 [uncultured Caudovirales phage]CAB5216851.1 hypothetical protein UFOVP197_2 [uncultured Caudovirales phage]